jgi:hypothetical protein
MRLFLKSPNSFIKQIILEMHLKEDFSKNKHKKFVELNLKLIIVSILFTERIMMAITREGDFLSRGEGEWRNSSEPLSASRILYFFYDCEKKLINKFHY